MNHEMKLSRRLFVCVVGLAICLTISVDLRAAENSSDTTELNVMTFNIRYGTANDGENHWRRRRDMVVDILRKYKPDVVGLQEALRFQLDVIGDALPEYGELGVGREDGKTKSEYSPILYNRKRLQLDESGTFWLSDTPETPGSITWGNACTRVCTWGRFVDKKTGQGFYLYNTHLDHISQPSREKSAVLLTQRIGRRIRPEPFILTGDFNAGESNPAITYLKGETKLRGADSELSLCPIPMVDTFRVLYPDANEVGTFNGFQGRRNGDKIDYILTTADIEVLDTQIICDQIEGRYPSDHFPVTAKLRLLLADKD